MHAYIYRNHRSRPDFRRAARTALLRQFAEDLIAFIGLAVLMLLLCTPLLLI